MDCKETLDVEKPIRLSCTRLPQCPQERYSQKCLNTMVSLLNGTDKVEDALILLFRSTGLQSRPRLVVQPQSLFKQKGNNVTIICQGSNLSNQYTWYKDRKPLSESSRVKTNNGTLFIGNVAMQDTGTYTCQSSSKYTRTATASLIVYGTQKMHKQ